MDEFKFVAKCFVFASLLMMFSQVRTGGLTLESKVEVFLTESITARYMQTAAQGGAKAIGEFYDSAKAFVSEKMNHTSSRSESVDANTI
ncbi:MAG: hypothetical protein WA160_05265 [Pseudobdellovibrio sp.]